MLNILNNLLIFLRIPLFHFIVSLSIISCQLLMDKPNESCQNSKKRLKEIAYPAQKRLLKRKGNSITPVKTNAPISQTSSEGLKLTIQTYPRRNKELKNEARPTSRENIKSIFAS